MASQWFGVYSQATNITVTGTGFPSGQTGINIGLISTSTAVTSSTVLSNALCLIDLSLVSTSGNTPCYSIPGIPGAPAGNVLGLSTGDNGFTQVTADANGFFQVVFQVPLVTGSPDVDYNLAATYSTSSGYVVSNSVPFTVEPAAALVGDYSGANTGTFNTRVDLLLAGFAAKETIQLLPSQNFLTTAPWGSAYFSTFETDAYGSSADEGLSTSGTQYQGGVGSCGIATGTLSAANLPYSTNPATQEPLTIAAQCDSAFIGNHASGSVNVEFIGVASGNTASTTFVLTPSLEFASSTVFGGTTFALPAAAGTAYLVGHNFVKDQSIPADSLTISGVTTIQSSTTAQSDGLFGPIAFTYTSSLPAGVQTATFDGATYSWANGNIVASPVLESLEDAATLAPAGILVATTSSISFTQNDGLSHHPGQITWMFGSCTGACSATGVSSGSTGTYTTTNSPTTAGAPPVGYAFTTTSLITTFGSLSLGAIGGVEGEFRAAGGNTAYWAAFQVPDSYGGANTGTEALGAAFGTPPTTSVTINMHLKPYFVTSASTSTSGTATGTQTSLFFSDTTQTWATGQWIGYVLTITGGVGAGETATVCSNTATSLDIDVSGVCNTGISPLVGFTTVPVTLASTYSLTNPQENPYPAYFADNTGSDFNIRVTGFNESDTSANVYLGSSFWASCSLPAADFATPGHAFCNVESHAIPDVGSGAYSLWVNGSAATNYGSTTLTILPVAGPVSLSSTTGVSPGSIEGLLTASGAGIHGLAANTKYTVEYSGTNTTTTFTSTSSGQVPPGVQFIIPSGTGGAHIIDIVSSSGVSVFYKSQMSTLGQYTHLTVLTSNSLTLTPTSGNVGSSVTVSGKGLGTSTNYYVWLPLYPGSAVFASYTSFTSDATGAIPSSSGTFTWPLMPTDANPATCAGFNVAYESGTLVTIYIAAKSGDITSLAPSAPVGTAKYFLEAGLGFPSGASAAAGSSVSYSATGLCASTGYNIVFNYALSITGTAFTGTTVGSFVSDSNGDATGSFTVPAGTPAGAYPVQLIRIGGFGAGVPNLGVLSEAPSLTVGAAPTTGLSTNTFAATGSASESTVNGQATLTQTYTNSYTSSLNVFMWVDVMNPAGQTVGVFLGSATVGSGASASIGAALFNLPSGSYTATVFITTTTGIVVSKTSTASFSV